LLSRFWRGVRAAVEDAVAQAARAVLLWVRQGIDDCMNRVNGEPKPEKPKKEKPEKAKPQSGQDTTEKPEPKTET
jgi:hypothetical protein